MGRHNRGALLCWEEVCTVLWARGTDPGQASPVSLLTLKSARKQPDAFAAVSPERALRCSPPP